MNEQLGPDDLAVGDRVSSLSRPADKSKVWTVTGWGPVSRHGRHAYRRVLLRDEEGRRWNNYTDNLRLIQRAADVPERAS